MNTRILKRANLAAIVAATTAVLFATSAMAASFQVLVTTLDDVSDFSGFQQVSDLPGPDGRVSFREAVAAANNTAGPQTIAFAIPPAEFWLVPNVGLLRLEQGAFFLNDSGTTVDFSTQTANMGDTNPNGPEIGIYGLEPNGWGIAAIFVNGDNCVVKGLGNVYQRGYAVQIVGDNNRVIGCQIDGPLHAAVSVSGYMGWPAPSGNIVGGTAPGEGNTLIGLVINGPAEGNIVIGNTLLVGVEVGGATQYGVIARNNRIGGPTPAERNVISGAGHYGEEGFPVGEQVSIVDADGTIVEGNYIGTTADGLHRYPQQIGPIGVEVRDSRGTTIRANLIAGLRVVGTDHYAGQVFGEAIHVGAVNANTDGTVIQGNTIGLAADGVTPIVTRSGINVSPFSSFYHAFGTRIASNHIASVETTGVVVASPENGVTITRNSIHDCGGLGIDLFSGYFAGVGGVTPNDPGDGDTGGNRLQNFPVLLSATTTGSAVMVQGTLDSSPSAQFTVEFFVSPSCDPSGFGEGAAFIGSTTVTTDGAGHATISLTLPAAVAVGARATATATRLSTGDTSEFSACVAVTSAGLPVANASATPTSGSAPLTVQFSSAGSSDPGGTITSYSWNFGDGGNSTAANPSHTYTSAGTCTATLTVYDSRGATGTTSLTIRVAGANQPPVAKNSATPTSGTAPLAVNFSSAGSSDPDGTIASYSWNFGDGTTSAATNPSHTYTSAGTYTAKLTVTDNAGSTASASVTITVTPSTAKTLRSTAINLSGTRSGSRVTVSGQVVVRDAANAAVSGVNVKVTWRKPGGTSVTQTGTTGSSGTVSFSTSGGRGTYTVTVNNLAKTGFTFDKVNSVLSMSITK